jgi:2-hydroxychromene-2-carboxylate isomerase
MAGVEFWCELASTYTYLAASRIESLGCARGVTVTWSPFLLGPIFAASGWQTSPFAIYAAKGRYMWRDVARGAQAQGIPFRRPTVFPRNTVLPARVALVGVERGWGPEFIRRALSANFAEDREISEAAVVAELLGELGHDAAAILEEATSEPWKPRLRSTTERAIALGIFGAPTFMVGEEMFWGSDRLEQAVDLAARPA